MRIESYLNDEAVLSEIGQRLTNRRIELGHTQADLAEQAGISKRTVERIEAGKPTQITNIIRILRILGWLENLERLMPETGPSPMDLLKHKGKKRQRASGQHAPSNEPWTWSDKT
ncbi:MAG: helix-turn-helix domain-containing protein [Candidatus Latescibacterota bacterium]